MAFLSPSSPKKIVANFHGLCIRILRKFKRLRESEHFCNQNQHTIKHRWTANDDAVIILNHFAYFTFRSAHITSAQIEIANNNIRKIESQITFSEEEKNYSANFRCIVARISKLGVDWELNRKPTTNTADWDTPFDFEAIFCVVQRKQNQNCLCELASGCGLRPFVIVDGHFVMNGFSSTKGK